jgi:Putative  PD-(D/E)XK family member, (DUF4420)
MTEAQRTSQIPTWGEIHERLELKQPHPILISLAPHLQALVEPSLPSIGLSAPCPDLQGITPRPARGVRVQAFAPGEAAIWIDEEGLIELGWTLLENVAMEVLLGRSLIEALESELHRWRTLVSNMAATTVEATVGVLGELVVLRAALELGHDPSVWVGRDGGAIDFRIGKLECEVKTTVGGRHEHIINGSEQLQPSAGFQLAIVSLLLAASEEGSGSSLLTLLSDVIAAGLERRSLEESLAHRGVHVGDPATRTFYILRSIPLLIDSRQVPAVTMAVLHDALGEQSSRIRDVSYRVDLEGLATVDDPVLLKIAQEATL